MYKKFTFFECDEFFFVLSKKRWKKIFYIYSMHFQNLNMINQNGWPKIRAINNCFEFSIGTSIEKSYTKFLDNTYKFPRKILNGANRNHWILFNTERVKTIQMWNLRSTKKFFCKFFNSSGMNNRFKVTSLWRQKQQPSPSMRALISKLRS